MAEAWDLDRRRLRDSRSSGGFFPLLTSAMELTVEAEGEFRFSGVSRVNAGSLLFPPADDGAAGVFSGETGFAGTGLPATTYLPGIMFQAHQVYADRAEHARMVFTCAKFGGGSGQWNDAKD